MKKLSIPLQSFSFLAINLEVVAHLIVEEEMLLYALVCTSFPENGYNIKAK
jgi:hypothetical protein